MKKNLIIFVLIISVLAMVSTSCRKKKSNTSSYPEPVSWSPEPGPEGTLPTSVLPKSLDSIVKQYITVNTGENPSLFNGHFGQFVSRPHTLIYSTIANDTVSVYNDRYIAFQFNDEYHLVDFFGKQWDDNKHEFYYETKRQLNVIGHGENFTCYYLTEGYPNGYKAKQATVFSGRWDDSYGGLKDFQVAVILLVTSGNPNLAPANSFRVLGDGDGLAQDTPWITGKRTIFDEVTVSAEDAFSMFRVR